MLFLNGSITCCVPFLSPFVSLVLLLLYLDYLTFYIHSFPLRLVGVLVPVPYSERPGLGALMVRKKISVASSAGGLLGSVNLIRRSDRA